MALRFLLRFPAFSQKEQSGPFFAFSWLFQTSLIALAAGLRAGRHPRVVVLCVIAPRAQSERSEASVAARGAGYQENGRASSVWTRPGTKLLPFQIVPYYGELVITKGQNPAGAIAIFCYYQFMDRQMMANQT